MTTPLSSEEIKELAAGYVLGDLTSAEAELFKELLTEIPDLQTEVAALQEALAMMPYGLDEAAPEGGLRSQILSAAQTKLSQQHSPQPQKNRVRLPGPWAISTVAAGLAIVGGLTTLRLSSQLQGLQTQLPDPAVSHQPSGINQTWSGLSQLQQDHQRSLANPNGPVDFVATQPAEILPNMQGFQTTMAALPLLPAKQAMLLGGSNCQLGQNQGLRLTYQLGAKQTVSAYQLDMEPEEFPELQSAQITVQQPDGTGIVLWRDDGYLYALVAELPTAKLQSLAYAIEGT